MQQLNIQLSKKASNKVLLRYLVAGQPLGFDDRLLEFEAIKEQVKKAETDYYTPIPVDLRKVGQALYEWLDGPDRHLEQAIAKMASDQLLVLAFEGEGELLHLPWELLHNGQQFLLQNQAPEMVPIRLRKANITARSPQNRALQLLFMATSPRDVKPELDFEAEEVRILDATKRLPLNLEVEESGNLDELHHLLRQMGPETVDVMHLSGHAHHQPTPHFLTEDENGDKLESTADDIKECFDAHRPSLLFLSGCSTGRMADKGAMPSLAEELLRRSFPAILAWAQPIKDTTATETTQPLYQALTEGQSIPKALHKTLNRLLGQADKFPDWHLLRLYANGRAPENLITRGRHAKRKAISKRYFLDDDKKVRVATRRSFVGRRRVLQDCLKVLRTPSNYYGIVLHGTGGLGKSSVAARLTQRLENGYRAVVLVGELDELVLLRKLGFDQSKPMDNLAQCFLEAFQTSDAGKRLLLVLDDFEQNFEQEDGKPKIYGSQKEVRLTAKAVKVLLALLKAIHQYERDDQHPQLFITSRYAFKLTGSANEPGTEVLHHIPLTRFSTEEWKRFYDRQETTDLDAKLVAKCQEVAGGNPRLLEWLLEVLRNGQGVDEETLIKQLEDKEEEFKEDVLAQYLWDAQSKETKQLLTCLAIFSIPVPIEVLAQYTQSLNAENHLNAAVNLGLAEYHPEAYENKKSHYRLVEVFASLMTKPSETEYYKAAEGLSGEWEVPKFVGQLAELCRLGINGGNRHVLVKHSRPYLKFLTHTHWYREAAKMGMEILKLDVKESFAYYYSALSIEILGDGRKALELYEMSYSIDKTNGNEQGAGATLLRIGALHADSGDFDKARESYDNAYISLKSSNDSKGIGACLHSMAMVYRQLGQMDKAMEIFQETLMISRKTGDRAGESATLNSLAGVYLYHGDFHKALSFYESSLEIEKSTHDAKGEGTTLYHIGIVKSKLGELGQALDLFNQSLSIFKRIGYEMGRAHALGMIAEVLHLSGNDIDAIKINDESLKISKSIGDKDGVSSILHNLAQIHESKGEYHDAKRLYEESLSIKKEIGDELGIASTVHNLATVYDNLEELDMALNFYQESLKMNKRLKNVIGIGETSGMLAQFLDVKLKRHKEALHLIYESLKIFGEKKPPQYYVTLELSSRIVQNWVLDELGVKALKTFLDKAKEDREEAFEWLREQGLEV